MIEVSSKIGKIILDYEFVQEYLRVQDETKSPNQSVIEVDDLDSSVEYIGTEMASPKTQKIAKMNERIDNLEKGIKRLTNNLEEEKKRNKKNDVAKSVVGVLMPNVPEETIATTSSNEPQASTSCASNSNSEIDFGVSINEDEINQLIDELQINGQLFDIANEIVDYFTQEEQQE